MYAPSHKLLRLEHDIVRASRPGVKRMYGSIWRHYCWECMAAELFDWLASSASCSRNRMAPTRRTAMLKLFPATDSFGSFSMDLLEPLTETKTGKVFFLILVERLWKLVRAVLLAGSTLTDVSVAYFRDWNSVCGSPGPSLDGQQTPVLLPVLPECVEPDGHPEPVHDHVPPADQQPGRAIQQDACGNVHALNRGPPGQLGRARLRVGAGVQLEATPENGRGPHGLGHPTAPGQVLLGTDAGRHDARPEPVGGRGQGRLPGVAQGLAPPSKVLDGQDTSPVQGGLLQESPPSPGIGDQW